MKRKILNPFAQLHDGDDQLNCFGCSTTNSIGLQLKFYDLGEEIETFWNPDRQYEGFLRVLHGGIQATLHDEIASWVVFTKCGTSGVTKNINIQYRSPVMVLNKELRITGRLLKQEDRSAIIHTCLYDPEGKLCSESEIEYFIFPLAVAKRKHYYPGVEAFYEQE